MKNYNRIIIIFFKNLICIGFLFFGNYSFASLVYASSFGYNSTNSTLAFQEAIQSSYDTIVVDLQDDDWNVEPNLFFDLTDKVIIFEKEVVLKAIPGLFDVGDCLLKLVRCSNITLIGYRATFKMNKPEYVLLNDSEYRHCLAIENSTNMKVFGLTFRDSGGDGVYIGGADYWEDDVTYSEDIVLKDIKCINNYRQGLSITSVQNMLVSNCLFTETKGTLPEAGVDIEPFETYQRIVNLRFKKCSFTNNGWSGIAVAMPYLDSTSMPISIKFSDCYLRNNRLPTNTYAASEIHIGSNDFSPVGGNVLFERCLVEDSQWTALYSRKTSAAFHVTFKDCAFKNISQQQIEYNEPIFLEVPNYEIPCPALGGFTFDNVLIKYNTDFDFFRVYGWSTLEGLEDIDGNFRIVEPYGNGVSYENVQDTSNVTFTYTTQTMLPPTALYFNIGIPQAVECNEQASTFTATRASDDIGYSLPVNYDTLGSTYFSDDVSLMTTALIIPTGYTSYTDSIFARDDLETEYLENITLILLPSLLYQSDSLTTINIDVLDCGLVELKENNLNKEILVYPNPTSGLISIFSIDSFDESIIRIFNTEGKTIFEESNASSNSLNIDFSGYENGVYLLKIIQNGVSFVSTIIKD